MSLAAITPPNFTSVDTALVVALGTIAYDAQSGKEYIYLAGVASTAANDAVTFDSATFLTTRMTTSGVGPVAVAQAAVTSATNYGWYQIYGNGSVNVSAATTASKPLYSGATTGQVTSSAVGAQSVFGLFSVGSTAGSGTVTCYINRPFATATATL